MPNKRIISKQLGELLIERKVINDAQLKKALQVQRTKGGLLGEILVLLGYAGEEAIAQTLTAQYGFPYLPLEGYELDKEVVIIIPRNVAEQYCLIAIDKMSNMLTIAMANPLNVAAVEDLEMLTKCRIQTFVATGSSIKAAIKRYYE